MLIRRVFLLLILFSLTACDQAGKLWAQQQLMGQAPLELLGGSLTLIYAQNPGAFLSLGAQWPTWLRSVVLLGLVGLLLFAMLWWLMRPGQRDRPWLLALTLMLAGGLGNLFDRVFRDGQVIDFILLDFQFFHTGIFNFADIFIVAGALLMLLGTLRKKPVHEIPY